MTSDGDADAYRRLAGLCTVVERWAKDRVYIPPVQAGSRTATDDALTAPYQLSHAVAVSLSGALDHLQALRALLVDAEALHMAAPFTLMRSAIESASQALWLLVPDDQLVRVQRRLQMAVGDARARSTALVLLDRPRAEAALQERLERFAQLADAAGVPRGNVLGRAPSISTMVRAASDVAALSDLSLELLWRLGSGYAHGHAWALLTAGAQEHVPAGEADPDVAHLSITADATTVVMFMGGAVLTLNKALYLHDRHRLFWRPGPAAS